MQALRNICGRSVEAVERWSSLTQQQAASLRHPSYLQASPAGTAKQLYQMFSFTFFKIITKYQTLTKRYAAAPASGCVLVHRQNITKYQTSPFAKLHQIPNFIAGAVPSHRFQPPAFSLNHHQILSMLICIFPKRKIFALSFHG